MKENQNKSFVLYTDYAKHIALLTNEESGELLKALFEYVEFGKQKQANLANAKNETLCKSNVADTDNDNENEHENDRNIYTKNFETFWAAYPRKADKGQCYKKYKARLKDGYSPDELLGAAVVYAEQCRRQRTEPQFIKHGKTFLGDSMSFTEFIPKTNTQPAETPRQEITGNPFRKNTN